MSLKGTIKHAVFGAPGERFRTIRVGLLRNRQFPIDTASSSMKIVGLWETEIIGAVRRMASKVSVACDIGCNTGWYALYFATRPNIATVLGFEPDTALVEQATCNLITNGEQLAAKVTIHNKFVGNRDDDHWCRLDTVLEDCRDTIGFKIDVDGGEVDVLKGATRMLTERQCELVIETHSVELERGCIELLQSLGYRTQIIKNGWYRCIVPETRNTEQNRWLRAWKPT